MNVFAYEAVNSNYIKIIDGPNILSTIRNYLINLYLNI
ncbi:hypothetical protein IC006_2507 [Sulfuracidifex tepidarius]|uniref:Uncharacterized protein n=1 Tax=Sulfuracidifex tepidarius TaxID=1294262 RepID=A0A510E602_9CREN|nr:hypothetical protein IC006_2507 [Sulfuracidifex tepidarius]BBG27963.1 hypothetical protein IC007_2518 [Sulfuracidifex tepidarius]